MKLTWWIAALIGLALGAMLWPPESRAEDYAKLFKERREARRGMSFKDHMDKYNTEIRNVPRNTGRPYIKPTRVLKTPQNRGKRCGSIRRYE